MDATTGPARTGSLTIRSVFSTKLKSVLGEACWGSSEAFLCVDGKAFPIYSAGEPHGVRRPDLTNTEDMLCQSAGSPMR
jgi:hypothetical protein